MVGAVIFADIKPDMARCLTAAEHQDVAKLALVGCLAELGPVAGPERTLNDGLAAPFGNHGHEQAAPWDGVSGESLGKPGFFGPIQNDGIVGRP
jgi:hypothetical protein